MRFPSAFSLFISEKKTARQLTNFMISGIMDRIVRKGGRCLMRCLLKGGQVYRDGSFFSADVAVEKGCVAEISSNIAPVLGDRVFDFSHCFLV